MVDIEGLDIRDARGGVIVPVKVVPGASRDRVVGVLAGSLKITTVGVAEKGRANTSVTRILAKTLQISTRDVTLVTGRSSPRKEFMIAGLSPQQLLKRLEAI